MHAFTPPPAHDVLVGFSTTARAGACAGADAASAPRRATATHDARASAGMDKFLTRQSSDSSQSSFACVDVSADRPDDAVSVDPRGTASAGSLGSVLGASAERRQRGLTAALMEGNALHVTARDGRSSQHSSDSDQDAFGTGDPRATGVEKRATSAFEPPVMVRANRASVMTARDVNDARWVIEREQRDIDQRVDDLFRGDALLEARSCPIDIPSAKRAHWKTYVVVARAVPRRVRACGSRCPDVSSSGPCLIHGEYHVLTWTRCPGCVAVGCPYRCTLC